MDQRILPKRKRDHPGDDDESPQKVPKFEEGGKAVTDAAAAAVGVTVLSGGPGIHEPLRP